MGGGGVLAPVNHINKTVVMFVTVKRTRVWMEFGAAEENTCFISGSAADTCVASLTSAAPGPLPTSAASEASSSAVWTAPGSPPQRLRSRRAAGPTPPSSRRHRP